MCFLEPVIWALELEPTWNLQEEIVCYRLQGMDLKLKWI